MNLSDERWSEILLSRDGEDGEVGSRGVGGYAIGLPVGYSHNVRERRTHKRAMRNSSVGLAGRYASSVSFKYRRY